MTLRRLNGLVSPKTNPQYFYADPRHDTPVNWYGSAITEPFTRLVGTNPGFHVINMWTTRCSESLQHHGPTDASCACSITWRTVLAGADVIIHLHDDGHRHRARATLSGAPFQHR
jgi:hypothetical protein